MKIAPEVLIKTSPYPSSTHLVFSTALSFLNAPYLWGGKSILGIDCSGLVQLCFNICGTELPRDARMQAEIGEEISLKNAICGDLAFFKNKEGRINHVGILKDNSCILHASGKVKIDKINETGILNKSGEYTHQLSHLKRIIT